MKIKITILLFILIAFFIARPVNAAETSQISPTVSQPPQTTPAPTQAVSPTSQASSPTPSPSSTDTNQAAQPTPQVVNIPTNSTSTNNNDSNNEVPQNNEQATEPTPFIVPEHAETKKSEQVYSQNTTEPTPPAQNLKISTLGIVDSNPENPIKNLYASERLTPFATRFLLIISGLFFVSGMVLFNFEKITKSTSEILPKRVVDNDPFFPSWDKV